MKSKKLSALIGFIFAVLITACSNDPQIADKTLYQAQQGQRDKYMPYLYGTWSGLQVFDDNLMAMSTRLKLSSDGTFEMADTLLERKTPQDSWQKKDCKYNDMRRGNWELVCKRNDSDNDVIETYLMLDERHQPSAYSVQYILFHDVDALKLHIDLVPLTELIKVTE